MSEHELVETFNQKLLELLSSKKDMLHLTESDIINSLGFVIRKGNKLKYGLNQELINKLDVNTVDEINSLWISL